MEKNIGTITLSERLKHALKLLKINQREFSQRSGIPQSTISQILSNKNPTADTLNRISILGINTHWLITGKGKPFFIEIEEGVINSITPLSNQEGIIDSRIPLVNKAAGEPVIKIDPPPEPAPGFEQRREIGQLLVKLDLDNLFHVRKMIDALIAAKQIR